MASSFACSADGDLIMFRRVIKGCVENALHTEALAINVNACSQNMFVVQYGTGIKE